MLVISLFSLTCLFSQKRLKYLFEVGEDVEDSDRSNWSLPSILRDSPELVDLHLGHFLDHVSDGVVRVYQNGVEIVQNSGWFDEMDEGVEGDSWSSEERDGFGEVTRVGGEEIDG